MVDNGPTTDAVDGRRRDPRGGRHSRNVDVELEIDAP
jgi:hypothetical protein